MGDLEVVMWRLFGFVGGEPTQPVPRDLVATWCPGGEEAGGASTGVDDMDGTVARVPERAAPCSTARRIPRPCARRGPPTRRALRSRTRGTPGMIEVVNHGHARRRHAGAGPP